MLLDESFIRGESRNPATCTMKLFATTHGCKIWIWMFFGFAGFLNLPVYLILMFYSSSILIVKGTLVQI